MRVKARTLCPRHYWKWRIYGDPLGGSRPGYGTKRRVRKDGYIDIYEPTHPLARRDGYVMEHRKVAWDAGLLTDSAMDVHHINHNRTDSRLENLKVKSKARHATDHFTERGTTTNQYGTWGSALHRGYRRGCECRNCVRARERSREWKAKR